MLLAGFKEEDANRGLSTGMAWGPTTGHCTWGGQCADGWWEQVMGAGDGWGAGAVADDGWAGDRWQKTCASMGICMAVHPCPGERSVSRVSSHCEQEDGVLQGRGAP